MRLRMALIVWRLLYSIDAYALAELNHISLERLVINSRRLDSQAHLIKSRLLDTRSSIERALKYAGKPWIRQSFFRQCFKSTISPKFLTTKVYHTVVFDLILLQYF